MAEHSHRSDPRILGRRTLERDHRRLVPYLRPGLSVLDVGCGTGAITAGIAKAVGPHGRVVGIDLDEVLLERARAEHGTVPNLEFRHGEAMALTFRAEFDVVTAARTLQWILNEHCKTGQW
jgi:ubiquinone/menaquinone biosynthesis C-methylase UbiE